MDLLLLGGTAFLGRVIATTARDRGHRVVCAARGSAPAPSGCEFVRVQRDHPEGLSPLAGRRWDAIVDLARQPGQVRRAVRLAAGHRVFVSTANVYARFDTAAPPETAELLDPLAADAMTSMGEYGAAKVACEQAVLAAPIGATVVRAGLIGGATDPSGRSGYYPWRFANPTGPDVLVPPDPTFPVAMIDVRDLAAFVVLAAEERIEGVFNATGLTHSLEDALALAAAVTGSTAVARPVPAEVLGRLQVGAWMGPRSLPWWIDDPAWRHFATMDTSAARAQGLWTRPLQETLAAALATESARTPREAGLTDDEERALRSALDD